MNRWFSKFSWDNLPFIANVCGTHKGPDSGKGSLHRKGKSEHFISALRPWESNMFTLQSILIWEKPKKSGVVISFLNFLYWYLALSNVRVFFMFSLMGLCIFLRNQWVYSIWPEISVPDTADQEEWTPLHPSMYSASELGCYLQRMSAYAKEKKNHMLIMRQRQPGKFCAITCLLFSFTWVLGFYLSGVILLYCLLLGVSCGPGIAVHVIPKSLFDRMTSFMVFVFGDKSMDKSCDSIESDLADFLPELKSEETQTALDLPCTSQDASTSQDLEFHPLPHIQDTTRRLAKADKDYLSLESSGTEGSSPFMRGLVDEEFPSLGESFDEEDGPRIGLPEMPINRPREDDIKFVNTHFGDSEDEEDEYFEEGLQFNEKLRESSENDSSPMEIAAPIFTSAASDIEGASASTAIANLMSAVVNQNPGDIFTTLGQNLVSSMIGTGTATRAVEDTTKPTQRMSQSYSYGEEEDDFEMLTDEDLH